MNASHGQAVSDPCLLPGRLERVLRAGCFAVTAELSPPDSVDPEDVYRRARQLEGCVDAINATDGSGGNCHISSVAVAALLVRAGYCPVMQITCRDRNRIAIQSEILGAAALGVENLLCLTGDDVGAGDHPGAKPVFDLDCMSLLEIARNMCDGAHFQSGRRLSTPPRLFLGAAANPFAPDLEFRVERLAKKVAAGARFVQTQYSFDVPRLHAFMREVRDRGLHERVFILAGIGPLPSARTAEWMRNHVPGVSIPEEIVARLQGADDQAREGRQICVEVLQQLRETEGIAGAHVFAYRQEHVVGELLERAGVLGGRHRHQSSLEVLYD